MVFIGIVTDFKSENNLKRLIKNNKNLNENEVIFIKEENVNNMKNVHFDTIVVNRKFEKVEELNNLLNNAKNVIINMDMSIQFNELNITKSNLITYGFNSKSSITISSITDDDVLICVQRNIYSNNEEIEVQDIKLENNKDYSIYDLIIILTMFLMYFPDNKRIHINGIK